MYRVGTLIFSANASARVDLPTPGTPASIETSALRNIILFASNVLKTEGKGSPPMSDLPILLTKVFTCAPVLSWKRGNHLPLITTPQPILILVLVELVCWLALVWCPLWCWARPECVRFPRCLAHSLAEDSCSVHASWVAQPTRR